MLLIAITVVLLTLDTVNAEYTEVCPFEGRQIRCNDHEVILIQSALYGRMRSGGCLTRTTSLGCSSDALSEVDRWCSGFRDCFIDEGMTWSLPVGDCPQKIARYMEITYTCVKVAQPEWVECRVKDYLPTTLRQREGFIASFTTYETHCGRASSPWVIEAADDHVININLFDFTPRKEKSSMSEAIYGFVFEDGARGKEIRFSSGIERNSHLYRSEGSRVLVYVDDRFNYDQRFMLQYEIIPKDTPITHNENGIRTLALSSGTKLKSNTFGFLLVVIGLIMAGFFQMH